ncbi:60S ribosomal protein-like [Trypanosoma brucei equiperdum]|uniref:60S ribosomal protein-like n=1 Tax=Trypanosoma brucei equiperdum TaxID=630700 RepID=A0A3L6L4U6_9TRYP|nr:60S ribosomal protein-like [Trypanosoma brucei equiperdum]
MRRVLCGVSVRCGALSSRFCSGGKADKPKLEELAATYSQLTLKELSDLQRLVFKKLGHSDDFYEKALLRGLGGGGAAVAFPVAAAAGAAPSGASATEAEPPKTEKKKVEKTSFDVKLEKYAPDIKVKLIKELRSVTNLSIADAKNAIEKCPGLVQTNMRKEDAEKLKGLFEKLGATVQLL